MQPQEREFIQQMAPWLPAASLPWEAGELAGAVTGGRLHLGSRLHRLSSSLRLDCWMEAEAWGKSLAGDPVVRRISERDL